jgi:uncharacterized membrane protein
MNDQPKFTDADLEGMISVVLRSGVLISGFFVLAGGIYFVARHAREIVDFHVFRGEPAVDRLIHEIMAGAFQLRARSIIQFGIVLLIATPIVRVVCSLVGFARERDRAYVLITGIVLAVLLLSLVSGAVLAAKPGITFVVLLFAFAG